MGFPRVAVGLADILTKMLLKIPNRWKMAIKPTKNPIIKEKSSNFLQTLSLIIVNKKRQKIIKNAKLINPPPLFGSPQKLNETSAEKSVEIKTVIE